MGSSYSEKTDKSDYGKIEIQSESEQYIAGAEFKGRMIADVLKPFPLNSAEVLVYKGPRYYHQR